MKKYKEIRKFLGLLFLLPVVIFSACKEESPLYNTEPIVINSIHLSDVDYPDREVTFARLGSLIRLNGSGFTGVTKLYINGESAYLNPTLMTDNSLIVRIPKDAPTTEASAEVRNTIRLVKASGVTLLYNFEIRSAAPTISTISHTLPQAGDSITIFGTNLYEISKVTFPGGVIQTLGIISDEDGKFCSLIVPAGITQSGAVFVEGSAGAAYSPEYFNFKEGVLNNFDDKNTHSWGGGYLSENLSTVLPTSGLGPKSQGNYRSLNVDKVNFATGSPKQAFAWADSKKFATLESIFPFTTPVKDMAFQFDLYVEGEWNSGSMHVVILDEFPTDALYELDFAPWIDKTGGNPVRVTYKNNSWFTVTIPLNNFGALAGEKTFKALIDKEATAQYHQYGLFFNNTDLEGIESIATNVVVYFDNFRFVPLTVPVYKEFGDDE